MRNFLLTLLLATAFSACSAAPKVIWTEGETLENEKGYAIHRLVIENAPAGDSWKMWFLQFRTPVEIQEGSNADINLVAGTLYVLTPHSQHGDTIVVNYKSKALVQQNRAPEGFILQTADGEKTPVQLTYNFLPVDEVRSFEYNPVETMVYDMVPALKKVEPLEGSTKFTEVKWQNADAPVHAWYRITIDGEITVESGDGDGAYYASVTMENLKRNAHGKELPNMIIEDWPDLPFRGLMLDVSRNFTSKEGVLKILDIMAHYKANIFHLHFGDDEGWRVEIPGIPELTSYGAFRGIPASVDGNGKIEERDALMPSYCASISRDDRQSSANGFYTREDFIEILRYAEQRHITVIPEFDTPGHSRAAIKAVEKYFERTGDSSYLLSEPEDTSKYVSVQDYRDNAINVALPTTYNFIAKIFDEIISMYADAGVTLKAVHIGGDEVPEGAWMGSPACRTLMERNGWTSAGQLKDYYISRVMDIAAERGVKIAGWQEAALHLSPATAARLKESMDYINCWNVRERGQFDQLPYKFANQGVKVVLSNGPNTYADMAYSYCKAERGHSWAGYVDERRSFSLLPYDIYRSVRWDDKCRKKDLAKSDAGKTPLVAKENIVGIQAQLWSETIRNFDHVTYYLFPKIVGLFERGWNASPRWQGSTVADDPAFMEDFDRYFSTVVRHEMPYYDEMGIVYKKQQ